MKKTVLTGGGGIAAPRGGLPSSAGTSTLAKVGGGSKKPAGRDMVHVQKLCFCRGPGQQSRSNTECEQMLPMIRTPSGQGEGVRGLPIDRKCPPGEGWPGTSVS